MAVRDKTITGLPGFGEYAFTCAWTGLTTASSDTGSPLEMPAYSERSVQVTGTIGTGTCVIEGSNDGTVYATLTDPQGNALSFTALGLEKVQECTRYIRPRMSAGADATLVVTMLIVKEHK